MVKNLRTAYAMLSPALIWLLIFMMIPIGIIVIISFTTGDGYGGIVYEFSVSGYKKTFDLLYLKIFLQSLVWTVTSTGITLLIAYPLAYFIAHAGRWKNILILLVMIPFWTNILVRMYAWIILLNDKGVINNFLIHFGIIDEPIQMMYTPFAMIITLVYAFLPFMILPIYASIEQLDKTYLEAAEDLGADPVKSFFKITLPLTLPGVIAGSVITFIPAVSIFAAADLFGGGKMVMIGNVIRDAFLGGMNWQLGSAISILLMILVLLPIFLYFKSTSSDNKISLF
ncbi:ABC transporter permease [Pseudogracilibacillus sp. SO30301A]|uniref:ABC transporter permease n=1 Tax=Pseudogracilibacillus sp. SO30301A TaxID=3098291 RepID=UPI00300E0589